MRSHVLWLLIVSVSAIPTHAVTYQWSQRYGDNVDQIPTSVGLDNTGNVILIGEFSGSIDFGNGALTCPTPAPCAYLAKVDNLGNPLWSRVLGDTLEKFTNTLAVDDSGAVMIASDFKGTVDMGGGPIVLSGFRDGIAARFDADGNHVWSKAFGGPGALVNVKASCTDGSGNFYVAGTFTGPVNFGDGVSITYTAFKTNMFMVKFDTSGGTLWAIKHTGALIEITGMDATWDGKVVLAGYHGGSFDFGGGPITAGVLNPFIAKYNTVGAHLWSKTFGTVSTQQHCTDVTVDLNGNVIIVGDFRDPLDFGGGNLISAGGWDAFVAEFDAAGNHLWSRCMGGTSTDRAFTVAVDGNGNVTVGGHFFGTADLGGGPTAADPVDFYATCFDAYGNHLWERRFDVQNLGLPSDKEYAIAGAANILGDLAFTGSFKDGIDCGGGALAGIGGWDAFVVRFEGSVSAVGSGPAVNAISLRVIPNPFNPQTRLTYTISTADRVRIDIFDVSGRRVRNLVNSRSIPGTHSATWDGRDDRGRSLSSGVYFARVATSNATNTARMVLLK